MSSRRTSDRRGVRRARRGALALLAPAALALALLASGSGAGSAAGASAEGEPTPQTDASVPAKNVILLGSSPGEAPAETWGVGRLGTSNRSSWVVVRYARAPGTGGSWSVGARLLDGEGHELSGFVPDQSPLTGAIAPGGAGALLGTAPAGHELLLVRAAGGDFQAAPDPTLAPGEHLYKPGVAPELAVLEEGGGKAGALVVPTPPEEEAEPRVLHWDGKSWSSEAIEVPAGFEGFHAIALSAADAQDAWLLGRSDSGAVSLFRRRSGAGGASWQPVAPAPGGEAGASLQVGGEPVTDPERTNAQLLDATPQGVWVDGEVKERTLSATMFFQPSGEAEGRVAGSWCAEGCSHTLPDPLPRGFSRSFAWSAAGTTYGQRVITGFPEGMSLRLEAGGSSNDFREVLALGAGASSAESVGGQYGAAFASPSEGWLGNQLLPVHMTTEPEPDMLQSWPVPFRQPLLSIAPQPDAPVAARTSQALAVGVGGEVVRYVPSEGWKPEPLLNLSGGREAPLLRSVAWPTPSRAYAVGTLGRQGQIWLWRAETGFWEPDPGTPINFRGKPLAVAFGAPGLGYVVGQQGLLMRYGKTWTQEPSCESGAPQPCLPLSAKALQTTSFTSIAFAGTEALVAYRVASFVQKNEGSEFHYTESGILVNDGSGWRIDESAHAALGEDIPWTVSGLPDGGAALSAESLGGGAPLILERQTPGGPWQPTFAPYPGVSLPGTLALFREGGALRVIGAGAEPDTQFTDSVPEAPPGAPPSFIETYPLASESSGTAGAVLLQTATGWRDEEHTLNDAGPPQGDYAGYDIVYKPDPIWDVLVNETGTEGWAVGGYVSETAAGRADTADIARYPREAQAPPGAGVAAPQAAPAHVARIAIGGGGQCAAPCALRARAGVGPDVWLRSAVATAGSYLHVPDFVYLGPRVTAGRTEGPAEGPVPYGHELGRYGSLLAEAEGAGPHVYAAASPSELELGSVCPVLEAWQADSSLAHALALGGGCNEGGQAAYYTFSAGAVKVIVLDQSHGADVDETQRRWLEAQLAGGGPAIVVGNSLPPVASATAAAIVQGKASAYFFEAAEENIKTQVKLAPGECGRCVPAYGTGTLGYVSAIGAERRNFRGASGFLLAEVPEGGGEVEVRLVPDIGELALEAKDGTVLHRSHAAEFAALARRPLAGGQAASKNSAENVSYAYTPIPDICQGEGCNGAIEPDYTFTSSNKGVADFVKRNVQSAEPRAILYDSHEEPVHDPEGKSGLLCAFNKGETTITITAGGLSSQLKVVVLGGSVRKPCGTVPSESKPTQVVLPEAGGPAGEPEPAGSPPPLVLLPPPAPAPSAAPGHPLPPFVFQPGLSVVPLPTIVPPPLPTPNPSPPSGTSAVTSPVEAAQKEEDHEEATESVSNQAVAYRASEHESPPAYLLGLVVLAAFAGATGARGRRRRDRGEARIAPATVSSRAVQPPRRRGW